MVGYKNWRQWWRTKEEKNETKLAHVRVIEELNIGLFSFFFSQNLVPFLFTPPLPLIPISHQLSR